MTVLTPFLTMRSSSYPEPWTAVDRIGAADGDIEVLVDELVSGVLCEALMATRCRISASLLAP
jgi:hypothetical protein